MPPPRLNALSSSSLPAYARTIGRGVHLRIHPRPANISESRKILSVLQKYGDVVMYQHLKHDPATRAANTALALYKEKAEAESLISASPLRLEMDSSSVRQLTRGELEKADQDEAIEGGSSGIVAKFAKDFHVIVEPTKMNFQALIQRQQYYGSFSLDKTDVIFQDLHTRVPVVGMADCRLDKGELPLRLRMKKMENERVYKRGAWREPLRAMREEG